MGDVTALRAAIELMLRNPEMAREMGRNGRFKYQERYSVHAVMPMIEAIYSALGAQQVIPG